MTTIEKVLRKITSGTGEWSDSSANCYYGCSNNCGYCYAKLIAIRFGRKTEETWSQMIPNTKAINKKYGKRKGRIMFPTSHDITIETYKDCLLVLKKLLRARNEVLITTKPSIIITSKLITELSKYKDQVQFRFTITSIDNDLLKFWEPNAPCFKERYLSLVLAWSFHYKTSVSIEPFLDKDPIFLAKYLAPFCSESIWIGKMNYLKKNNLMEIEKEQYQKIRNIVSWPNIQTIINGLRLLPDKIKSKIRIKDSIVNMYNKRGLEVKL